MSFSLNAFSQKDITGNWYGVLKVMGMELRVSFTIQNDNDSLSAIMASLDQGVSNIPMESVVFKGNSLSISQSAMQMNFEGKVNQDFTFIEGMFKQAGQEFELDLGREEIIKKVLNRPQEPKPPFSYYSEEVEFENKSAKIKLSGTLTLPSSKGKHPVVVLISGSGPQDRNEELMGHKPFLVLADYLTKKGIGVLRFDDRGTAKSSGDHSLATTEDFATDVEAAIDFLKKRKDIDKSKIGLIGHSEGGLIAPIVASRSKKLAYVVLLAGPGIPGDEILLAQGRLIALAEGVDSTTVEKNLAEAKTMYDIIKQNDKEEAERKLVEFVRKQIEALPDDEKKAIPDVDVYISQSIMTLNNNWFRFFLSFDPQQTLEKVNCPVLAINGTLDLQVPYRENLEAIKSAIPENEFSLIKSLPNLNHLFQTTKTGAISEYGELEETISPIALEEISTWLLNVINN